MARMTKATSKAATSLSHSKVSQPQCQAEPGVCFPCAQSYCKGCTAKQHANWRTARPERAPSVASKLCGGCKQQKTASEFYADRKRSDGLQCQCKACTSQHHKNWRDARRRSKRSILPRLLTLAIPSYL